jgi:hypothetical protein
MAANVNGRITSEFPAFRAARYMDDILMVYACNGVWDHNGFLDAFTASECYLKPLTLVDAKDDTFLETTFKTDGTRFQTSLA